jgi:lipopolysaccharide transport system permease protein
MNANANNILNYQHLIRKIAISDFKLRYKSTVLGFFWSLLEPLLMLVVLYVVFTNLMKMRVEHYQLFLLMGIVSWDFLAKGTGMSLNCILGKPGLVKHVYFPREVLVISSCITAFMMAMLEFLVFALFMVFFGVIPGLTVIYFPIILLIEFILILGLSFGLGALNVYYRDVQYIWAVVLQAGFFAAPIIYPMSVLPPKIASVIMLNPMTRIIGMFRDSVIYNTQLIVMDVSYALASALILLAIGYIIFRRFEPRLAEEM